MANGIYCETLLRVRPYSANSMWHILTFEREGDGKRPKNFLCKADIARKLETGEVCLFSAKGRYILRFANLDVPLNHLSLEYLLLHLSFARRPWPQSIQAIIDALHAPNGQPPEALAEFVTAHAKELLASLPSCRYHWRKHMNLEFIPAENADIETIFAQLKQLIDAYEDLSSIQYDKVLAWCHRQIEENIGQYTCILADGEKAGWYNLSPSDNGRMELDNFYVLPRFRNRGIGTAALEKCIGETDKPIFLYCFTKNTRALALYTRMGFRKIEDVGITRCIMQRGHSEG